MTNKRTVSDAERRQTDLEHLAKLADDRWREYDHKSQAEWKLSYSIWGAQLAAGGALLTADIFIERANLALLLVVFVALALLIHFLFLLWIQRRLREIRDQMRPILERRQELLRLPIDAKADQSSLTKRLFGIRREAMYVQCAITVLLGSLLVGIAYFG